MVKDRLVSREILLEHLPKGSIGAEIGVWRGGFSKQILETVEPKILYLVDPWSYQPKFRNTTFGKRKNVDNMSNYYEMVRDMFIDEPRVRIMRMQSDEAWAKFDDHSLDWVYIDGNHNAPVVNQDLESALRKVKPNGIISGDDFYWEAKPGVQPVKAAVDEIAEQLGDQAKFKLFGAQYLIYLNRE